MTAWIGGEMWWLSAPFESATTKDIGKKRIMIGRDCGFFVVVDSNSMSLTPIIGKIARSQAAIMNYVSSRFSDRWWLLFKN